jgi:hypothetical protein
LLRKRCAGMPSLNLLNNGLPYLFHCRHAILRDNGLQGDAYLFVSTEASLCAGKNACVAATPHIHTLLMALLSCVAS